MICIIDGNPVAKPRMTRRDKWAKRPCVVRYFAWCNGARDTLKMPKKLRLTQPTAIRVKLFFACPKRTHRVGPHTVKPDGDNCLKSVCDALFENDQMIYDKHITKLWCDGGRPRVEVEWW